MKRVVALIAAIAFAMGIATSAWAGTGTCASRGGGQAPGHPGVVLGPATKCVRSSSSDRVINVAPAASARKLVFPWEAAGVATSVLAASFVARKIRSRRATRSLRKAA